MRAVEQPEEEPGNRLARVTHATVYAIAQLRFTDRAAYDRYQSRVMEVFRRHPGTLLAADESPQVVEGHWEWDKVVLLSFPDEAAFRSWADSPDTTLAYGEFFPSWYADSRVAGTASRSRYTPISCSRILIRR
jgi:uncharacterized protein (DUF1330 family)